jgi:cell division inhibitor SulA/protein ImuA
MLRCSAFGAVLVWPGAVNDKTLRRLQLAAEAGSNLAILYRPAAAAQMSSPAALRLALSATDDGMRIEIKKCRGGIAGRFIRCTLPPQRAASA